MNGTVVGVGVDLLRRGSIYPPYLTDEDPFLRATFSNGERAEAEHRRDAYAFYETRFCAKEAVFKSLGISGEHVSFSEIEILNDVNGVPRVTLYGALRKLAAERGIDEILLSLTGENDYAAAFAVAQSLSGGKEK